MIGIPADPATTALLMSAIALTDLNQNARMIAVALIQRGGEARMRDLYRDIDDQVPSPPDRCKALAALVAANIVLREKIDGREHLAINAHPITWGAMSPQVSEFLFGSQWQRAAMAIAGSEPDPRLLFGEI